jgi:hypothetical protein
MLQHIDVEHEISATKLATLLFGAVYVSGYLITAVYARSRGIASLPFLMAQYIETGLAFCVVTAIPVGIPYLLRKIRGPLGHPGRWKMDWILLFLTSVVAANFLLIVAFQAIFLTGPDWRVEITLLGLKIWLPWMISLFVLIQTTILVTIAAIRIRARPRYGYSEIAHDFQGSRAWAFGLNIVALLFCILADLIIYSEVFWAKQFVKEVRPYFLTVFLFVVAVFLMHYLSKKLREEIQRRFIWVIGATTMLLCYYLCIMAYSYSVYEYVPTSRGGISPTTRTHIFYKNDFLKANTAPPAVYVMEESESMLYCVPDTTSNWMEAPIFAVPKCDIAYLYVEKLPDGRPHIKPRD